MYTYIVIDDEKFTRMGTIKKLQPMADQITCIGEADFGCYTHPGHRHPARTY